MLRLPTYLLLTWTVIFQLPFFHLSSQHSISSHRERLNLACPSLWSYQVRGLLRNFFRIQKWGKTTTWLHSGIFSVSASAYWIQASSEHYSAGTNSDTTSFHEGIFVPISRLLKRQWNIISSEMWYSCCKLYSVKSGVICLCRQSFVLGLVRTPRDVDKAYFFLYVFMTVQVGISKSFSLGRPTQVIYHQQLLKQKAWSAPISFKMFRFQQKWKAFVYC